MAFGCPGMAFTLSLASLSEVGGPHKVYGDLRQPTMRPPTPKRGTMNSSLYLGVSTLPFSHRFKAVVLGYARQPLSLTNLVFAVLFYTSVNGNPRDSFCSVFVRRESRTLSADSRLDPSSCCHYRRRSAHLVQTWAP